MPLGPHRSITHAGAGGILRRAQHKGAAERLDQRRDEGILPQHLGFDFIRHTGKICLAVGSRGRGRARPPCRPAGHPVSATLSAHCSSCAHSRRWRHRLSAPRPAHCWRRLAFWACAQGFQLGRICCTARWQLRPLLIGGVFAALPQAADPGIVLIFQAHFPSSISGSMLTSAPAFFLGIFTV